MRDARLLPLSPRQLEILQMFANGLQAKQLGREVDSSHRTVQTHCRALKERLGVNTITHAVATAIRTGLIK